MQFSSPLIPGRLLRRYKRFLADVRLEDGTESTVYCPNPGRMIGCSQPGARVLMSRSNAPKRKLALTLELYRDDAGWICINPLRSNTIVAEALAERALGEFTGFETIRTEAPVAPGCRLDFRLDAPRRTAWIEVKTTTLVRGTTGQFPDAVTVRGRKHLQHLAELARRSHEAYALFVIARPGCQRFAPADDIDPAYGEALRAAAQAGVRVRAFSSQVSPELFKLGPAVPVALG